MRYSSMGTMRLPFIDSELLYRGALKARFDCTKLHSAVNTNWDGKKIYSVVAQ